MSTDQQLRLVYAAVAGSVLLLLLAARFVVPAASRARIVFLRKPALRVAIALLAAFILLQVALFIMLFEV